MAQQRKPRNPFYPLLVIVGTLFAVTAVAYGLMAVSELRASAGLSNGSTAHPLWEWLRLHGDVTMLIELAALAALTFAAIGTDSYWDKQSERQ